MKKNIQTHKTDLGKGIFQLGDSVLLGSLNTPAQQLSHQQFLQFHLYPLILNTIFFFPLFLSLSLQWPSKPFTFPTFPISITSRRMHHSLYTLLVSPKVAKCFLIFILY